MPKTKSLPTKFPIKHAKAIVRQIHGFLISLSREYPTEQDGSHVFYDGLIGRDSDFLKIGYRLQNDRGYQMLPTSSHKQKIVKAIRDIITPYDATGELLVKIESTQDTDPEKGSLHQVTVGYPIVDAVAVA